MRVFHTLMLVLWASIAAGHYTGKNLVDGIEVLGLILIIALDHINELVKVSNDY